MTRLISACLSAAFLTAISVGGAAAARVETFHDRFADTYEATFCDVDLTINQTVVVNGNITTDSQGHVLFQFTVAAHETWTNAAGDWISLSIYGTSAKDVSVVDDHDGGFTVTYAFDGIPLWFRDSSGATISKDVGRAVFAATFDADGNFVSQSTVSLAGPHPAAVNGDPGCQIVSTYLD